MGHTLAQDAFGRKGGALVVASTLSAGFGRLLLLLCRGPMPRPYTLSRGGARRRRMPNEAPHPVGMTGFPAHDDARGEEVGKWLEQCIWSREGYRKTGVVRGGGSYLQGVGRSEFYEVGGDTHTTSEWVST